ncbi:uncharacterized protein LOC122663645 [Telopea speciosissima]|uniref:uncharacterized protein LOC122663645 n=1 Tax=Telopea speciosissima TaxID=54955 RepID=UPI001CC4C700|nr:uncharacterized protein LOC122663645 [Telopea speciosissima]XP_043715186.1 uncharacterized protein LOC122663645 [Telopea speciosissima]
MALIANQTQGSYAAFSSTPISSTKGVKLKPFVARQLSRRSDGWTSSKHRLHLSIGTSRVLGPVRRPLKILAFKGSAQSNESGSRSSGYKLPKDSVKLSYVPHEGEETATESLDVQNVYASEGDGTSLGSVAIQKLFKKWLMILRTKSSSPATNGVLGERPSESKISEHQSDDQKQVTVKIVKAAWCYFLGLDAMIKIPLLIFIPWYLAVNIVYGSSVSKELRPLWILGPLIMALYIKMLQGLCALYVFTFKQTMIVVKNFPTYTLLAYNYMAQGKLKEDLRARFWQPVLDTKNLDYKALSKRKLIEFGEWVAEKYVDYVESIWPFYCRTIRFLKKANLI